MLAKLRVQKAKEVQEKAQNFILFFCALCFVGRELAPYDPFFFGFSA
jgi:hypothetical protein